MSIKKILVLVWTGICAVVSAVFFVLFEQEGKKNRQLQEESARQQAENEKASREKIEAVQKTYVSELKKNEELVENLNTDNAADAIASSDKLLQQVRESGRKRNRT